jgi:hypothetical protein
VFTVLANGKASDAAATYKKLVDSRGSGACQGQAGGDCAALEGLLQDKATFSNVALWSFVGAGVVGAGTLIYALITPKKAATTAVCVTPALTANSGGLWVHGAW